MVFGLLYCGTLESLISGRILNRKIGEFGKRVEWTSPRSSLPSCLIRLGPLWLRLRRARKGQADSLPSSKRARSLNSQLSTFNSASTPNSGPPSRTQRAPRLVRSQRIFSGPNRQRAPLPSLGFFLLTSYLVRPPSSGLRRLASVLPPSAVSRLLAPSRSRHFPGNWGLPGIEGVHSHGDMRVNALGADHHGPQTSSPIRCELLRFTRRRQSVA